MDECGRTQGEMPVAVLMIVPQRVEEEFYHGNETRWPVPRSSVPAWRKLLVGESEALQSVVEMIALAGARRSTVLISGETGTGKELVARALHMASPRSAFPIVSINCTAFPEALLEAELFGYVRGAFTGALQARIGRFEMANHGTLFLDEIGDMSLETQAKLLRVLQEREFQRLGSSDSVHIDIRVIAATNADLSERVANKTFREDLYYRLHVVPITLPPLRDRISDIPLLVDHFLEKICRQEDLPRKHANWETMQTLMDYHWPGNVRQLENAVERAVAFSGDRLYLYPEDFRLPMTVGPMPVVQPEYEDIQLPEQGLDFEQTVGRIEKALIQEALRRTNGNKKQAAEILKLKRTTLTAKIKSLEAAAL